MALMVISTDASSHIANALLLIPAEQRSLIKWKICGKYAYPASSAPLRPTKLGQFILMIAIINDLTEKVVVLYLSEVSCLVVAPTDIMLIYGFAAKTSSTTGPLCRLFQSRKTTYY